MAQVKLLSGGGAGRKGYTSLGGAAPWLGTLNYVVKSGAATLANSIIYDNGTTVSIGTATPVGYRLWIYGNTSGHVAIGIKNAGAGVGGYAALILNNTISDLASELSLLSTGYTPTTLKFPSTLYLGNHLAAGQISIVTEGATGRIYFGTNNTFREIINETGYHGINTSSPLAYLQIETSNISTLPVAYFSMTGLAHGITGIMPTNVFAAFKPRAGGIPANQPIAGLWIQAISCEFGGVGGWESPFTLDAIYAGSGPTDVPTIKFIGSRQDGTSVKDLADNQRILHIANRDKMRLGIMGSGWIIQFGGAYPHADAPSCILHSKKSSESATEMTYLIDNINGVQGDEETPTYNYSQFKAAAGDSSVIGVLRSAYQLGYDGVYCGSTTDHYFFLIQNDTVRALIDDSGFFHAKYKSWDGTAGFTGTGSYTNFTIKDGIITAAS